MPQAWLAISILSAGVDEVTGKRTVKMWSVYDSDVRLDGIQAMGRKAYTMRHLECDIKMYALGVKLKSQRLWATEGLSLFKWLTKQWSRPNPDSCVTLRPTAWLNGTGTPFSRTSGLAAMTFRGYGGSDLNRSLDHHHAPC
jgi:hypothetical protein